ncbi:response regulator transcription factor [Streptomyces sp. NPDC127038]|uniref:response regulator transcription factor n=1 Tax=Streptomyces sp. NPDC127038 TaxID=3347114 RepID=UPI00364DF3D5
MTGGPPARSSSSGCGTVTSGLDAGADGYLVRSFTLRAHQRRRPPSSNPEEGPIRVGDLTVGTSARRCLLAAAEVALRPKEYELLAVLTGHAGVAVVREALMAQVRDENWFGTTKTLKVSVASLCRRLGEAAAARDVAAGTPCRTRTGARMPWPRDWPHGGLGEPGLLGRLWQLRDDACPAPCPGRQRGWCAGGARRRR